jgi:hypothetical protein
MSRLAQATAVPDVRCTQPWMSPQRWRKASLRIAFSRTWWVVKGTVGRTATTRCNWVGPSQDALAAEGTVPALKKNTLGDGRGVGVSCGCNCLHSNGGTPPCPCLLPLLAISIVLPLLGFCQAVDTVSREKMGLRFHGHKVCCIHAAAVLSLKLTLCREMCTRVQLGPCHRHAG